MTIESYGASPPRAASSSVLNGKLEHHRLVVAVVLALLQAVVEAVLERADPVEAAAVGVWDRVWRCPGLSRRVQDAGQGGVQIGGVDVEHAVVLRMFRPRAREAVGLQLTGHGACGEVRPGLHGVAPFVGHHHRDDEIAELVTADPGSRPWASQATTSSVEQ